MSWWNRLTEALGTPAVSHDAPPTLVAPTGEVPRERRVFDPALQQYPQAFAVDDPPLDETRRTVFLDARRRVLAAALAALATGPDASRLVLRGSAAMPFYLGERAREPKDLDFVVEPAGLTIDSAEGAALLERLKALIGGLRVEGVTFAADRVAWSDIWTYARAPGCRLVVPWIMDDGVWDVLQLDIVFGEVLLRPAQPLASGLRIAPPDLALAWKILWLWTDMHTQAKDLYDAALLTTVTRIEQSLLEQVFAAADEKLPVGRPIDEDFHLEWVGFDPALLGDDDRNTAARAWWTRLNRALAQAWVLPSQR